MMSKKILKIVALFICVTMLTVPLVASESVEYDHSDVKNLNSLNNDDGFYNAKIQEIIDKIDEDLVRGFMEHLVFDIGSRYTGTYGCQKAAEYIGGSFEDMGLMVRFQDWTAWGNRWHPGHFSAQNVEGRLVGSDPNYDEEIIFNAHYDSVKNTVGANDDGSGTVGVLAAAYVLSQYSFKRSMRFVTFSGEEIGLCGSHAYATDLYKNRVPILVEINADMIGRATTSDTGKTIRLSLTEDAGWVADVMQNITEESGLGFNITPGWSINRDASRGGSDYFDFIQHGYESVCVWEGEGDPYMHTPMDNISNVNFSYLVNTTRHIAATMAVLGDIDVEPPRVSIQNPRYRQVFFGDTWFKNIDFRIPWVFDETNVYVEVRQGIYDVDRVEFYMDNRLVYNDTESPYEFVLNKRSIGVHKVRAVVFDTMGNTATDELKMFFINPLIR